MIRKIFYRIAALAVFVYVSLLAGLFIKQRELLYHIEPQRAEIAAAKILNLEERTLTTEDGERLVAWLIPPRGKSKFVLLYFQGNAWNLGYPKRVETFRSLTADGTGLLAIGYRGYGGSSGHPTEAGLHLDAKAAYQEAARLYGAERLIAYGQSLGTGVATRLAFDQKVAALILEAPFLSASAVAQSRYWYVPVRLLMLDPFRSDEIIGRLNIPVLILHGDQDRTIPVEQGRALYMLAKAPKRLAIFKGGDHDDLQHHGLTKQVQDFLDAIQKKKLKPQEIRNLP